MRKMIALAVVAGFLFAGPAQAQDKEKKEKVKPYRFTAFAVNMNSGPKAGMVDINLERLTSPEERDALIAAFVEGGQDALLKALQKVKPRVGYIRSPNSLGYDLQYAWRIVNSDGTSRDHHRHRPAGQLLRGQPPDEDDGLPVHDYRDAARHQG